MNNQNVQAGGQLMHSGRQAANSLHVVVSQVAAVPGELVATLGPRGTSSEAAGHELATCLGLADDAVILLPSYEEARAAVVSGRADRFLVANAYHGINEFYMDLRFTLERAFVFDTPTYGLASRRNAPLPLSCEVITHPAPQALIRQLMPPGYWIAKIDTALSTSAAAVSVARGEVDLALTTSPAADRYGLTFISPTRPIRMLWSVFVLAPEATGGESCACAKDFYPALRRHGNSI